MQNWIDIHTHILPGIDDGSRSMETSLEMARVAVESGVRHLVVTPHSMPGIFDNYPGDSLLNLLNDFRKKLEEEHIPLYVYQGMECFGDNRFIDRLKNQEIWTINHSKYFLIEFSFDEDPAFCNEILSTSQQMGYIPVIAHPERYYFVQDDPQLVYAWFRGGCGIQVNKGSILGSLGRREQKTAFRLLEHGVVNCVASDAHNLSSRSTSFTRLSDTLLQHFGSEYTELVLHENPARILKGEELVSYPPISFLSDYGEIE